MTPVGEATSGQPRSPAGRFELLQGRLLALPEPDLGHQDAVGTVYLALRAWAEPTKAGQVLLSPFILRLGEHDVLQPDLCFVAAGGRALIGAEGVAGAPELIVEVLAPATAERDRLLKRAIYEGHGVPEYWIVDPVAGMVQVLRRGGDGLQPRRAVPYSSVAHRAMAQRASLTSAPMARGDGSSPGSLLAGPGALLRPPRPAWRSPGLPWRRLRSLDAAVYIPAGPGAGQGPEPAAHLGPTWERLSAEFLEACRRRGLRPHTLRGHARDLQAFSRWYQTRPGGGALVASAVSTSDMLAYRSWLAARYRPITTNGRLATLAWLFELALARGHLAHNPAAGIRPLAEAQLGPRTLRRDEVARLLQAAAQRSQRHATLIALIANTGLRLREALSLTWSDLRLGQGAGSLRVRRGRDGGHVELPLNAAACAWLERWRLSGGPGKPPPGAPIFTSDGQRPLPISGVQAALTRYSRRCGLVPPATSLALRHTFCNMLIQAGVPLDQVRALAGHVWLSTTTRYTRPTAADLARDVSRLDWS